MPALTTIQLRRGTSVEWASSMNALTQGEMGFDTTIKKFKIGDGSTLWSGLPWANLMGADFVGVSGVNISYSSPSGSVTVSVTGLNANYISDFASSVSGLLPVKSLIAGNNISVTPTGDKGFVISTNGIDSNTVKDVIGSTITGVSGVLFNYNSVAKTATVSLLDPSIQSTDVTDFNTAVSGLLSVKSLVQGSGIGIVNNSGAQTISVTGIPSSLITDLGNVATTQVVGRTGIALTYDAINDAMFIDTTGVSLVGHTHLWSNVTDASTRATLAELTYLSGVVSGTASPSRALVLDNTRSIVGINNLATTGNITVGGNLVVQGTTTTVNSTTVEIGDNIIRVNTSGLNTGGMEVYTGTDTKSVVWNRSANRWEFTGADVYTTGNFIGSLSGNASTVTNGVYTTDSGTVTSTMIANDTIVNADINSAAAIAYSKLNLGSSIVNSDINSSAAIAYSKLNLSGSISNGDISSSAAIAVNKLASSGVTIGNTTINLGTTATTLAGLTSISGVSAANPTTLYYCVIDGGTP